jgi:anti-sigma regulatory factor (Ser/Thr protein kinase)
VQPVRPAYPLPNRPESASRARAWVTITLTAAGHADLIDPAVRIISEMAANAAVHATHSDMIKIVCEVDADTLTLGVIDGDPRQPVRFDVSDDDERGRGLLLISATADEWGCRPCDGGKIVFALLHIPQTPAARPQPCAAKPLAGRRPACAGR